MFRGILSLALLGATLASVHHFTWQDCDSDPSRALKISSIDVSPMPIVMPGPLTFSLNANLTKAVEGGKVELEMKRHVPILGYIHVPCILGVGSCDVEFCKEGTIQKSHGDIQKIIDDYHINAACPIQPQSAAITQATIQIKDPGTLASVIAAGDYIIKATIKDRSNNEVGCVSMKVELKRHHHGFLFR